MLGFAAEPTFNVPHGFYSTTQSVAIATTTPGAIIVYTTNGSTPQVDANLNVTNGTLYTGPLSISATTTLRAGAFKAGFRAVVRRGQLVHFRQRRDQPVAAGQVPAGWAPNGVNGQEINYGIDPDIINLYGATGGEELAALALDDFDHDRPGQPVRPGDRHLRQREQPRQLLGAAGERRVDQSRRQRAASK